MPLIDKEGKEHLSKKPQKMISEHIFKWVNKWMVCLKKERMDSSSDRNKKSEL